MSVRINAASRTHVGLVRRRNEDAFYLGESLAAVADGLGGHIAGDIASTAVIEALRALDRGVDPTGLPDALGKAINTANETLRRRIRAAPQLLGMGSTLVALLWSGTVAALANVGDSRAYVLRGRGSGYGVTSQLTEDHTFQHLVADAASVPDMPERMCRWLDGRADGRSPDLSVRHLRPGDRFLLCSDGLSSYVPHDLIHAALNSSNDSDETADHLIALALDYGAPDNVTVIVIDIQAT